MNTGINLRVTGVNKIFSDSRHNAFPGICRFGEYVYVAFRSADNHISYNGVLTVLRSKDLKSWDVVTVIESAGEDLRDACLLSANNEIFLYTFFRQENGLIQSSLYVSKNGTDFEKRALSGLPESKILWDITKYNNSFYGSVYDYSTINDMAFYKSDDGLNWSLLSNSPVNGNETAIDFDEDGTMHALIRCDRQGAIPYLAKLTPPYDKVDSYIALPVKLQGPRLKRINGTSIIIGRNWNKPGRTYLRTDIHTIEDGGDLEFLRTLPSGGDTSYASWLDMESGSALLVYYSAHEHRMDASFDEQSSSGRKSMEHSCGADIFLANISYMPNKGD